MKRLLVIVVLIFGGSLTANADVWKWVDAFGKTHFVNTMTPIYTWIDEFGKVNYSDTPDHEDAVSVELVWLSTGSLDGVADSEDAGGESGSSDYAYPGETAEDRAEREKAEAYYCKRATEIYDSYLNAPQLYRTNDSGKREYLSKKDTAAKIAETKTRVNELCS
jgi:hypothetical protein